MSLTAEQHAIRKSGITSSDIQRIVGESPWGTACDVYTDKITEEAPKPSTLYQRIGDLLEPLACDLAAEHFGLSLQPGATVRNEIFPWAIATPDRFSSDGVVEAKVKSVSFARRGEWDDDDAPPAYVHIQAQWHCLVTKRPVCHVVALIECKPRFFIVESDQELGAALLEAGQQFHERHVLPRIPPPVDGSEGARRMIAAVWPRNRTAAIKATPEAEQAARAYFEAKRIIKANEAIAEQAAQDLKVFVGDADGAVGDGWRLALKWQDPQMVETFERRGFRRFDLRAAKGR